MVMHVDHSSGGSGVLNFVDLEPPEPDFAPPVPPPAPPPAPPAPAPTNWVEQLPPAVFGPPAPHPGEAPPATVLATLAPPPAVAVIETPPAAPVVVAAVATATAAPTAPTASAMEIATLELTLADPLNQELIHHHGGALPVLDLAILNPVLQEQVDRYGADLTARLMQLAQANAAVRDLYVQAMDQAAQNLSPDTMGAVFVPGSWAGGDSDPVPDTWRFDPVAFTQAYAQAGQQDGAPLAQRAFVAAYGTDALQAWERHHAGDAEFTERGFTLAGGFELSAPTRTDLDGHPNRERMGWTGASLNADSHALRPLSLTAPPELHNPQAVWFDATLGWVTPSENVVVKQDFLDKAIPVVFIGVMTWATAGAMNIAGGAGVATGAGIGAGAGVASAMTAGAAFGAIGGFYSGLINEGRIDLGGMFRGALTGAVTAGVVRATGLDSMGIKTSTNGQGQQIITGIEYTQRALAVTGQATLQGALQQISGGEFIDGFTSGLAQGLGAEVARGLQLQIDTLSASRSIDATQAGALRQFARVAQSAVSLLGNPDDPGHAFAMTFVNGLVSDVQQGLTAHEAQTVSPAWASAPDETGAETARLGRAGNGPGSDAGYRNGSDIDSDNAYQARRDQEWATQNDGILARRGDEVPVSRNQDGYAVLPSGRVVQPNVAVLVSEGVPVADFASDSASRRSESDYRAAADRAALGIASIEDMRILDRFPTAQRIDSSLIAVGPSSLVRTDGGPVTYSFYEGTGQAYWDLGEGNTLREIPRAFIQPTLLDAAFADPSNPFANGPRMGNVLGDFGLFNAGGVAGMATGGWAFAAMRSAGHGLLAAGASAGVVGDLVVQASDNAAWLASGGEYGRSGINGTELALSASLSSLPGLPGAVRAWADDLRGVGVPDWSIRLSPAGTLNANGIGVQLERIGGSDLFRNQMPDSLADELAAASRAGVSPTRIGDPTFDQIVNQGTVKYVVTEHGELLVVPHTAGQTEISHAVLSQGRPVRAAGQAEIAGNSETYIGIAISAHSGHYLNGATIEMSAMSLARAREAFARTGIIFPD